VLPAQYFAGEAGIQQALLEEQGDRTATPDLGEGGGGSQGDEEEAVVAVEAAFQDDGVPMGMPDAELAEGLVARDHGAAEGPYGGLAEEAPEDVEEQSAEIGEELPVVTEEYT
jgi:hypothetical protein